MTYREERTRDTNWVWWIIAAIGAAAIVFLVWLLLTGNGGPEAGVTTDDLTDDEDAQAFVGRQVTVSDEITEVLSLNAFTIGGGDFFGGEGLLVVGAEDTWPVPLAVNPEDAEGADDEFLETDDVVQVTGEVRMFVVAEFEDELGIDLDDDLYVDFEDRPAILASEVDATPEQDEANEPVADATIDEIIDTPEVYVGDQVTVSGEVNQELDQFGFQVGGEDFLEGEGLLVVSADTQAISELTEAEEELAAQVTGTVQLFNLTDVEDELGVDLDDDLYSDFEGEPVLIASEIQVVPLSG